MVRHIVLFAFQDHAPVSDLCAAFAALPQQIALIRRFESGTSISTEQLEQGYTHAFVLQFDHPEDLAAYLIHPAHQAFVEQVKPALRQVLVFDLAIDG